MMSAGAYFARHAQTLVGSLGRIADTPFASLMTMSVIGIALALPLGLYVFLQNAQQAGSGWTDAFNLSVYLSKSTTDARTAQLAHGLRARADVAKVRVILAPQALAEFRKYSGFGAALDALEVNPLPNTLVVTPAARARTPAGTEALQHAIAGMAGVDQVELDSAWIERLLAMIALLRRIALLTGGLLGIGVALIAGNTIRLDILNRRPEIELMKLIGGTDGFVRRPFLYGGLWYGLGGGLIALAITAIAVAAVATPVAHLAQLYASPFRLAGLHAATAGFVLLAASLLGWLGSWIAATQHIRAIKPS